MRIPLKVTFKNMPHSDAIEAKISEKSAKLDRFFDRITSCRVVVDESQSRHQKGKLYSIHLDITVPGKELAVSRQENEDPYIAIRDAFDTAVRLLEEHGRILHGQVKARVEPERGRIVKIYPESDYGFIKTSDAREIYFHRNSMLDAIDLSQLKFGTEVSFIEEQGDKGPQAVRVAVSR
jgi:ribosomal subunit interface protein